MKKRIAFLVAVVLTASVLLAALPFGAYALEYPDAAEAQAVMLIHNDSETVLFEKNAGTLMPAGVGMRLLAALTFMDFYGSDTGRLVTVDRRVAGLASSTLVTTSGAPGGLKSGEQVPVYDLLCAMLIANSDDAAYAMLFDLFGGESAPVAAALKMMEEKAVALGALRTVPSDLLGAVPSVEGESYSTSCASDLVKIALAVQKNPILRGVCGTARYVMPETDRTAARLLLTRNSFLSAERVPGFTYSAVTGLAASESKAFGSCGVFSAQYEGRGYTCVVLGGGEQQDAFRVARRFFEWGSKNFSYKKVLDTTEILGEVKVELSSEFDYVTVSPVSAISVFLPNDADISSEIRREVHCESIVQTPVSEGQKLGTVDVYYKGTKIGSCDLVTGSSLPLSNSGYYFSLFLNFILSPVFITVVIVVAALFVLCVFVNARVRYLRKTRPSSLYYDDSDEEPPEKLNESAVYEAFAEKEAKEYAGEEKDEKLPARIAKKSSKKGEKAKKRGKKENTPEKNEAGLPKEAPAAADKESAPEEEKFAGPEELTTLELLAAEAEAEERARAEEEERLERARLAAEKAAKEGERKIFYDVEKDEFAPDEEDGPNDAPEGGDDGTALPDGTGQTEKIDENETKEENTDLAYEPEGWGDHR